MPTCLQRFPQNRAGPTPLGSTVHHTAIPAPWVHTTSAISPLPVRGCRPKLRFHRSHSFPKYVNSYKSCPAGPHTDGPYFSARNRSWAISHPSATVLSVFASFLPVTNVGTLTQNHRSLSQESNPLLDDNYIWAKYIFIEREVNQNPI